MKKYFEYTDAVSNKFWEINLKGNQVIITFGRIGNKPQQIKKKFSSNEESKKFAETKIKEKTNKGYREKTNKGYIIKKVEKDTKKPIKTKVKKNELDDKEKLIDIKKKVLISLKKKIETKKLSTQTQKNFDLSKVLSTYLLRQFENSQYAVGDKIYGANSFRIVIEFYSDFLRKYDDKNFKKKIFDLLITSKNKTPQSGKERKIDCYQSGDKFSVTPNPDEAGIRGREVNYGDKHNPEFQHQFTYCNKTKIDFFKGPTNDAKQIIKLGFDKLFSYSFIYGYLDGAINTIFKIGFLDNSFFDPLHIPSKKPKLGHSPGEKEKYDKINIRNIKIEFFKKFYKFSKLKSEKIIDDIEASIFQSKLSHYLLITKENYFITQYKDIFKDKKDGSRDFLKKISDEDENEFKNIKDLRIKKILDFTRKKQKIKWSYYYGNDMSCILNYEQFRFYTLHNPCSETLDDKELNLNEKDIFIRYAIYMGVQEIQFYIHHRIFGGF